MSETNFKHKLFKVPDKVVNYINRSLRSIPVNDKQTKGLQRAQDIIDKKVIGYGQMKRLKNYFDTYNGDGTDDEFKLVGGDITRKWVLGALKQDRESIKKVKKARMDAGEKNQFIKPHTKDKDNANPTNPNGGLVDITKGSTLRNIMTGDAIYKSSDNKNEAYDRKIQSIKYLIEYMSKT